MQYRSYGIFASALFSLCYIVTVNGSTFNNFNVLQVHVDDIATSIARGINVEAKNLLDCTRKCTKDLGCASVMYSENLALKCRKFSTSVTLMVGADVPSVASGSVTLATKMNYLVPGASTTTTDSTTTAVGTTTTSTETTTTAGAATTTTETTTETETTTTPQVITTGTTLTYSTAVPPPTITTTAESSCGSCGCCSKYSDDFLFYASTLITGWSKGFTAASAEECKQACIDETEFTCISVDWFVSTSNCQLDTRTMCTDPYDVSFGVDNADHYQRVCDAD